VCTAKARGQRKHRPLGIATIRDRALQSVVKSALQPSWEARFEGTSYGFRPGRSCHGSIAKIYLLNYPRRRRKWEVEAEPTSKERATPHSEPKSMSDNSGNWKFIREEGADMNLRRFARLLTILALFTAGEAAFQSRSVRADILKSQPAARALLSASGNGISNTRTFRAPGDWRIVYSFNHCQIPGFDIYVKRDVDDVFSTHGNSGHGTQYEHSGGRVYLTLNTACSWHVVAYAGAPIVNGPGFSTSGNGIANTVKLRVPSEWRIIYSFSGCQIPGFDIYVKGDVDDLMSKSGKSGHGVQYEHSGGTVYLATNTACSWRIRVSR